MPNTYYPSNDAEFALWLANFKNKAVANRETLGLSADQIEGLNAGLTEFNDNLALRQQKQEEAVAQTAKVREHRQTLNKLVGQLNAVVKANPSVNGSLLEELGLNRRENSASGNSVYSPVDLVVTGTSDGVNHVKWKRENNKRGTLFIIEAKIGDSANFVIVGVSTAVNFEHKNQTPGVKTSYRVKAKRGETESGYSNTAVIYS